jgi:hypothetical protein
MQRVMPPKAPVVEGLFEGGTKHIPRQRRAEFRGTYLDVRER